MMHKTNLFLTLILLMAGLNGCVEDKKSDLTYASCPDSSEVFYYMQQEKPDVFKRQDPFGKQNYDDHILTWKPDWVNTRECRRKIFFGLLGKSETNEDRNKPFDIDSARRRGQIFNNIQYFLVAPQKEIAYARDDVGEIEVHTYTPPNPNDRTILLIPGGAYVVNLDSNGSIYNSYASALAKSTGSKVYMFKYPLIPANDLTDLQKATLDVYKNLLNKGIKSDKISMVAVSAGGGLALTLLFELREKKLPMPSHSIVIAPWTDLGYTGESITKFNDPTLPKSGLDPVAKAILNGRSPTDPMVSPLFGDYTGLPPMLVITDDSEPLTDDSLRLAEKAKRQGVNTELYVMKNTFHAGPIYIDFYEEADEAMERVVDFIKRHS